MHDATPSAEAWLRMLRLPNGAERSRFQAAWGQSGGLLDERLALAARVVALFCQRHGAGRSIRLFRAPARVNLRGMHVDTHGGYLNLMTHQREVIAAVSPREDGAVRLTNLDQPDAAFRIAELTAPEAFAQDWRVYNADPAVRRRLAALGDHWQRYAEGAVAAAARRAPTGRMRGFDAAVGSDIPAGAALSSSHALCLALFDAVVGLAGAGVSDGERILACREAEWYAGARSGVSDQGAMVLARAGKVATGALHADDLERNPAALPDVRQTPLPDDLRLLVINSMTERSLSGAARADYTRNRFAYSMAMSILRRELEQEGAPADVCAKAQRLAMISEPRLGAWGTPQRLTALLKRVPAQASLEELRTRYGLEDLDALYEQSFGGLPGKQRPQAFDLRGPLVYGIAESRRAERFPEALRAGDYPRAGRLMNLGHDGDRRVDATGRPFYVDTSEAALDALVASGAGIEACPGSYRASSPVLDALVDAARFGGAYGACLTGAGIAGTVLALCHAEAATSVADRVSVRLASNDYARLAGWEKPPSPEAARDAVAVNASSAPAGEVRAATAPAR